MLVAVYTGTVLVPVCSMDDELMATVAVEVGVGIIVSLGNEAISAAVGASISELVVVPVVTFVEDAMIVVVAVYA